MQHFPHLICIYSRKPKIIQKERTKIMKKILILFLFTGMISLAGCQFLQTSKPKEENAQIANPFQDCKNMEEAEALAGFDMKTPNKIPEYKKAIIQAIKGELLQVYYAKGEEEILIRKGNGSDDISGIYEEFDSEEQVFSDNKKITLKSNGTKTYLATWIENTYAYSIWCSEGMDKKEILNLIQQTC